MSSLVSRLVPAVAAGAGVAAFTFPLTTPWHLLTVAFAAGAAVAAVGGRERCVVGSAAIVASVLVLLGYMPSPLAATAFSVAGLCVTGRIGIALAVLLVNVTAAASAEQLIADFFHQANLESAAPAATMTIALLLASSRVRPIAGTLAYCLLSIAAVQLGNWLASAPGVVLALGATPITIGASVLATAKPAPRASLAPLGIVFVAALGTWIWTLPKASGEVWVLLPKAPESYEAKYFDYFAEALTFAGINAQTAAAPENIPINAIVVLPWLTAGFSDENHLGVLARERRWTLLAAGEHTDMGDVAKRIRAMSGRDLLRHDLTVPPGNSDYSGPLRILGLFAWSHRSVLNRGASVKISSLTEKVLLAGDGWWAKPDIKEWLWVGDYVWRPKDRAGRLALAAVSDISGVRWVVVGDNSPFLNEQIYADPRAVNRLLRAATLWPAILFDMLLAVVAIIAIAAPYPVALIIIPATASLLMAFLEYPSGAWRDSYVGESGFDERNFNKTLATHPELVDGRRLFRVKAPVSGYYKLPDGALTLFMLVRDNADVAGVHLDQCHRIGSLSASEGVYLMDGQACRIRGNARILIGTPDAAAAIAVPNGSGEAVVILDTAFLSRTAPEVNIRWLLHEIGRQRNTQTEKNE